MITPDPGSDPLVPSAYSDADDRTALKNPRLERPKDGVTRISSFSTKKAGLFPPRLPREAAAAPGYGRSKRARKATMKVTWRASLLSEYGPRYHDGATVPGRAPLAGHARHVRLLPGFPTPLTARPVPRGTIKSHESMKICGSSRYDACVSNKRKRLRSSTPLHSRASRKFALASVFASLMDGSRSCSVTQCPVFGETRQGNCKSFNRRVDRRPVTGVQGDFDVVEIDAAAFTASSGTLLVACAIEQNPPNRLGGGGEEKEGALR